jgi:tetratricopeptide (TPR) repeat protein
MPSDTKPERLIKCFVASPSDCPRERDHCEEVAKKLNDSFARALNSRVQIIRHETTQAHYGPKAQNVLDEKIRDCDVFAMILYSRWGRRDPDSLYSSNTEGEFQTAVRSFQQHGRPFIYVFFRSVPPEFRSQPGEQLKPILEFRQKLEDEGRILFKEYEKPEDFGMRFQDALEEVLLGRAAELQARMSAQQPKAHQVLPLPKENVAAKNQSTLGDQSKRAKHAKDVANRGDVAQARSEFTALLYEADDLESLAMASDFFISDHQLDAAETAVSRALTLLGDKQSSDWVQFTVRRAQLLHDRGNPKGAIAIAQNALDAAEKSKDLMGVASAQRAIGNAFFSLGDYLGSEIAHRESLRCGEELQHDGVISGAAANLASALMKLGKNDEATSLLRRAIDLEIGRGATRRVAMISITLANVLSQQGRVKESVDLLSELLQDALARNDSVIIGKTAGNLFSHAVEREDVANARYYLSLVQSNMKEPADDEQSAVLHHTLAGLLVQTDSPGAAEATCNKAIELYERVDNLPGIAGANLTLTKIYEAQGKNEDARLCAERAFLLFKRLRDLHGIATSLHNLGVTSRNAGHTHEAISHVRQSIVLFEKLGNKGAVANASVQLGMMYVEVDQRGVACEIWRSALAIYRELKDIGGVNGVSLLLKDFCS